MRSKWLLCVIALLFSSVALLAQSDRGNIQGQVTDDKGGVLTGATVVLTSPSAGLTQKALTNESGVYHFDLLNPGLYNIVVDQKGFKKIERRNVQVDVNSHVNLDFTLQVGSASEVIEVAAEGLQIETTSSSIGTVIEQKNIRELPLIYSNPYTLEFLAPGLSPTSVNPNLHVYDSTASGVSIHGSVLNAIEYSLDGAPNNRIRLSAYTPSTEFINQYKMETSTYDASQGHSAGGFVNTSLKSGGNQYHGSIFGSYQNPGLNSNYALVAAQAKPTWLRMGGDVGGAFLKDKLFFFVGYEHSRQASPNPQTLTVPTDAERTGDFSSLLALNSANAKGVAYSVCSTYGQTLSNPNPYQLYDPRNVAVDSKGVVTRKCIPGNNLARIPGYSMSTLVKNILSYYPSATPGLGNADGTNNFVYSGQEPDYYYAVASRADYNLSNSAKLYGHFVNSRRLQPGKNAYFSPISGTAMKYINRAGVIGYTKTLSDATVLDARASWSFFSNTNLMHAQGVTNATKLGMPSYLSGDYLGAAGNAMPRFDLSGYTSLNSDSGVISHDHILMGNVTLSHMSGNHMFKFGGEYRYYTVSGGSTLGSTSYGPNGDYVSKGTYMTAGSKSSAYGGGLGASLAELELGLDDTSYLTIPTQFSTHVSYLGGFVHDTWRARRNLTINLGVRYEMETAMRERNNRAATFFDASATSAIGSAAASAYIASKTAAGSTLLPSSFNVVGGLLYAGHDGTSTALYKAPKLTMLPRVGVSWSLDDKTAVQAGFGLFADSLYSYYMSGGNAGSTTSFLVTQTGYNATTTQAESNDNGATFVASLANPFPNGILTATGSSLGTATGVGGSLTYNDPNPRAPYNVRWSLGVERQFGKWIGKIEYVGNRGLHLFVTQDINAIPRAYMSTNTTSYDATTYTALTATVPNPFIGLTPGSTYNTAKTIAVGQLLRPFPQFTSILDYKTGGTSMYHGLEFTINRRFANHLSVMSSFTWSRTMDATAYLNQTDAHLWRGVSALDFPLRYACSAVYELPFGKDRTWLNGMKVLTPIVSGWQIQGTWQTQSGAPVDFSKSNAYVLNAGYNLHDISVGRDYYKKHGVWFDVTHTENINGVATTILGAFDTNTGSTGDASGQQPLPNVNYQLRSFPLRLSNLRVDRLNDVDLGVQRTFDVRNNLKIQIRAEAINAFNHPVWGSTSTNSSAQMSSMVPGNSAFAQIASQANQPRVIQFAAFVRF